MSFYTSYSCNLKCYLFPLSGLTVETGESIIMLSHTGTGLGRGKGSQQSCALNSEVSKFQQGRDLSSLDRAHSSEKRLGLSKFLSSFLGLLDANRFYPLTFCCWSFVLVCFQKYVFLYFSPFVLHLQINNSK